MLESVVNHSMSRFFLRASTDPFSRSLFANNFRTPELFGPISTLSFLHAY